MLVFSYAHFRRSFKNNGEYYSLSPFAIFCNEYRFYILGYPEDVSDQSVTMVRIDHGQTVKAIFIDKETVYTIAEVILQLFEDLGTIQLVDDNIND